MIEVGLPQMKLPYRPNADSKGYATKYKHNNPETFKQRDDFARLVGLFMIVNLLLEV